MYFLNSVFGQKDLFASAIEKVKNILDDKNPNLETRDEKATAVGVGAIVFYLMVVISYFSNGFLTNYIYLELVLIAVLTALVSKIYDNLYK